MLYANYLHERKNVLTRVTAFIEEHKPCFQYPGFVAAYTGFQKRYQKAMQIQRSTESSGTSLKKLHRQNLAKEASLMGNLIYSYANARKNTVLKNSIHYTYSDFYRPPQNTMLGRCRQVLNSARKIKDGIDFAITLQNIQNLETAIEKYKEYMHAPQVFIIKNARAYKQQDKLITECFSIINTHLLPFIQMEYKNNSSLADRFKDECTIKKTPGRKRKYVRKPAKANLVNTIPVSQIVLKRVCFIKTTAMHKIKLRAVVNA